MIRPWIVSGNLDIGIEIGGNASGVQVTETAVGTNTSINAGLPNGKNGILIPGEASRNTIGSFQPTVEPETTISANRREGLEDVGQACEDIILQTRIGKDALGTED